MNKYHFTWTAFALAGLLLFAQCGGGDAEDRGNNSTERHDGSDDNGAGTNSDDGDFDNGSDYVDDTITEPNTL